MLLLLLNWLLLLSILLLRLLKLSLLLSRLLVRRLHLHPSVRLTRRNGAGSARMHRRRAVNPHLLLRRDLRGIVRRPVWSRSSERRWRCDRRVSEGLMRLRLLLLLLVGCR